MSNPVDSPLPRVTDEVPKLRITFEVGSTLPPIKLARVTQGSSHHWLFQVGAYEHQESYSCEREAERFEPLPRFDRAVGRPSLDCSLSL